MKIRYLFLIVVFGFLIRVILLDKFPVSLNWDEVSHGYNAYSMLKTGTDEWGRLPIANFRAYGDYPLPLNLYITIPFVALMGLSELAIRLPHAILGGATIISVYFLVSGLTKNKNLALLASFLASISPWYIFTSRFVLQSNISIFLLISAFAFFFNREKHRYFLPTTFLFLGLTLFSYHSTRIFTPILAVFMLFLYKGEFVSGLKAKKPEFLLSILVLLVFFLPLPFILSNPEARARANVVFLINEGAVNKIIESRNASFLPDGLKRLVYNRPTYFASEFTKNYIQYFSPQFLFLKGGTQYQFSVPNTGLYFVVSAPFFYLGLFVLLKKILKKDRDFIFIFLWLILAPIPASITSEKFAVLRATTILPLPDILIGLGVLFVFDFIKKTKKEVSALFILSYLAIILFSLEGYAVKYFSDYSKEYSWSWQYGYKEVAHFVKENYQNYDKIIITKKYGEPHEFILFFMNWDPASYKSDKNLVRFAQSNWFWVDRFDKFYFVNDWEIPKDDKWRLESKVEFNTKGERAVLVTAPGNAPEGWKFIRQVNFLDGNVAFEIYEN